MLLILGHISLVFGLFEPIQALLSPLTQAWALLSWEPGQIVIVYVPRKMLKVSHQ